MATLSLSSTTANIHCAIDPLVLAFSADPAARWLYPRTHQYLKYFPEFIRAIAGEAFETKTAYTIANYSGTALWLPPGVQSDSQAIEALLQQTVSPSQEIIYAVSEQMGHYRPQEPHWYLAALGVEPTQRRKGYGSALIKPVLAKCDRDNQLAYLESSNPANVPFYERYGFQLLGTIQSDTSPTLFPMVRYPHST